MHMEEVLDHHVIKRSTHPRPLPRSNFEFTLPKSFVSQGERFEVKEFLEETLNTGLLIVKDGAIVYEKYNHGMTPETTHFSFSLAKSFTSALIGFCLKDELIRDVDEKVVKYVPELAGSGYELASISDCLEMSSGVKFYEDYGAQKTDMAKFQKHLIFGRPMIDFLKTLPPDKTPGTYNAYNSMDAQVLGYVIKSVIGQRSLSDYLYEKLWEPCGMEDNAQWVVDGEGTELSLGGLNVTLRDYAKFGQLYLQKGRWMDKEILAEEWIDLSTKPDKPQLMPGRDNPLSSKPYGYKFLWWTPEIPVNGDYVASGIYNQLIYIHPAKNIVIVNTSANYKYPQAPEEWKMRYIELMQAIATEM